MHEVYTPFFNPALEGSFSVPWNPILWAPLLGKASANYHCSLIPFCSTELQNRRPEQFYAISYKYNIKMTYIKLGSKKSIKCLSVTTKNSKVLCNSSSYPYTSLGFISQPPDTEMCQSEYALCSSYAQLSGMKFQGCCHPCPIPVHSSVFLGLSLVCLEHQFEGLRKYCQFPTASQKVPFGGVFWSAALSCSGTTSFMGHTGVRLWIASIWMKSEFFYGIFPFQCRRIGIRLLWILLVTLKT